MHGNVGWKLIISQEQQVISPYSSMVIHSKMQGLTCNFISRNKKKYQQRHLTDRAQKKQVLDNLLYSNYSTFLPYTPQPSSLNVQWLHQVASPYASCRASCSPVKGHHSVSSGLTTGNHLLKEDGQKNSYSAHLQRTHFN